MYKQFLHLSRHSLVYGLGAAASSLTAFLLLPLYTRYLSASDYGVLEVFTATSTVLGLISGLGLATGLFLSYFKYDDEERRSTVVSTAALSLTAMSLVMCGVLLVASGALSSLVFGSDMYAFHFRVVFLTLFCDTSVALAFLVLRAKGRSYRFVLLALLRIVVSSGLGVVFVAVARKGLLGVLEAHLVTSAALYCLMIPCLIRNAGLRFSRGDLREMLAFGMPYVPSDISIWGLTLMDRYFLQFLSTPTELGLYSIGYKFGMVAGVIIVQPFALAWGPFFWSITRREDFGKIMSRVFTYFVLAGVLVVLVLSVLSREALRVMATPEFYGAHKVIPLIAMSYVLYGCFTTLGVGINLERKTKFMPIMTGCAAMVNVALNFLLIPAHGMMGAAVATLVSYLLLPIGMFFISRRYYAVAYEWGRMAKILAAAGVVYAVSLAVSVDSLFVAGILKAAVLMMFPVLLWLMRFYDPEEVRRAKETVRAVPRCVSPKLRRTGG